jgi:hypothetical protein
VQAHDNLTSCRCSSHGSCSDASVLEWQRIDGVMGSVKKIVGSLMLKTDASGAW